MKLCQACRVQKHVGEGLRSCRDVRKPVAQWHDAMISSNTLDTVVVVLTVVAKVDIIWINSLYWLVNVEQTPAK